MTAPTDHYVEAMPVCQHPNCDAETFHVDGFCETHGTAATVCSTCGRSEGAPCRECRILAASDAFIEAQRSLEGQQTEDEADHADLQAEATGAATRRDGRL